MEKCKIRGTNVTSPYPVQLTPGEYRLVFSLQKIFPPEQIIADCYLPKPDNNRTKHTVSDANLIQIDCLAVSRQGIFVFESKDYIGWIYGHGDRIHWTQVSAYGQNKHQFYNPVRQNATHINALKAVTPEVPIHSIIVFGREATLKVLADIPEDCFVITQGNLRSQLTNFPAPNVLTNKEIQQTLATIRAACVAPSRITRDEHIAEISKA